MAQECVVSDSKNPCLEFFRIPETVTRQVGLDIGILCDIVGERGVPTA